MARLTRLLATMLCALFAAAPNANAAELVTLSPDNYEQYAPQGKERDAFVGDYVMRNDRITLTIADPRLMTGRSASRWSIANVAGTIIDLTRVDEQNDHLIAFYPARPRFKPDAPNYQHELIHENHAHQQPGREPVKAKRVELDMPAYQATTGRMLERIEALEPHLRGAPQPYIEVKYILEDGWDYVLVETTYVNPTDKAWATTPGGKFVVHGNNNSVAAALGIVDIPTLPQAYARVTEGGGPLNVQKKAAVKAGGRVTTREYVIPGRSAVDVSTTAAKLRGERGPDQQGEPLRVILTDPTGPVEDAIVTPGIIASVAYLPVGHTDAQGVETFPFTPDFVTVQSAGRNQSVNVDEAIQDGQIEIRLPAAAMLHVETADETGHSIPAEIRILGRDQTPTPDLFPNDGTHAAHNILRTHNGQITHPLPPGDYDLLITHGPEYETHRANVTLKPGETTKVNATLSRVVDTTGWVSADMQNHTTISGSQELFYIYPYSKNPTTDLDSHASVQGRVLSLLAQHVEFAPATEHNFTYDYTPLVHQLGATAHIKTVAGIGLTAGRRHTLTHQNVFPMNYRPGQQDGGVLQRPEHIRQLEWMENWTDEPENRLNQIVIPRGETVAPRPGMHVLDVVDLEPIVHGRPIANRDNRILNWLELLTTGYRIPAVVTSNTYDNHTGAGGLRTYINSTTDDPARIDVNDIVRELKAGHATMTTGPFLNASLITPDSRSHLPGDTVRLPAGDVKLNIRVQAHAATTIDRLQVLVDGRHPAAVDLSRDKNPDRFTDTVTQFDHTIDLTLDDDAYLIVVASGTGDDLCPTAKAGAKRTHVAVTNPFWVDAGDAGYSPHSPLEDAVAPVIQFVERPVMREGSEPGRIRVSLTNRSGTPARDDIELLVQPQGALRLLDPATQTYDLPYRGSNANIEWRVAFDPAFIDKHFPLRSNYMNAADFGIRVARSAKTPGRRPTGTWMQMDHHVGSVPPFDQVNAVDHALEDELVYPLRDKRTKETFAQMRMAIAGDHFALAARVDEANLTRHDIVWEGSCLELYMCMPGRHPKNNELKPGGWYPINIVYLAPAAGGKPAQAFIERDGEIVPEPSIRVTSEKTDAGYLLQALVPLKAVRIDIDEIARTIYAAGGYVDVSLLDLEARPGRFLLEARLHTQPNANGPRRSGMIFGGNAPHVDSSYFGRMRAEGPVHARLAVKRPLQPAADAPPASVQLTLRNDSDTPRADTVQLRIEPADAARVVGQARVDYKLQPGETRTVDFDITLNPGANVNFVNLVLPRSPGGDIIATPSPRLKVVDRPINKVDDALTLDRVKDALASSQDWPIRINDETRANVRFALAGDRLAIYADVEDHHVTQAPRPWKASDFEVFGSTANSDNIGQIFIVPATPDQPAKALHAHRGDIVQARGAQVSTTLTDQGYQLTALLPLTLLQIDPAATQLLLEFQLGSHDKQGQLAYGTAFGSPRAYQDTSLYGRFQAKPQTHE